ncbi:MULTISPECIES: TonB family protein [unclassified Psychrobacter]|uniref:TonB family protein n=1 Tax=unclassified Psychrobacter TaxID=196806 RepID=UPI00094717AA|nr:MULTISPECIES: TonB family protein [unclassified Psychrobacter]OLF38210.1 hypothetical protein BTV98_05040 [Psychrobacter sp. Cmf 22.2]
MNSPERPMINALEPKTIQLELITLSALSNEKPDVRPKLKSVSQPQESLPPVQEVTEQTENIKLTKSAKPAPILEAIEPELKAEPLKPIKESVIATKEPKSNQETKDFSSEQKLVITESRKISNAKDEAESDLSAMILAVTKQFNREQAIQQQAVQSQSNRKRIEQDKLQLQAVNDAVSKVLATDQASERKPEQLAPDDKIDESSEVVPFLEEQASWLGEYEPNTSLPLLIWRNTTARSGDIFHVLLELHVDKNGHITEVQLLQSSGNVIIDAVAMIQIREGQLNPFQKNGVLVNATVPMQLNYEMP